MNQRGAALRGRPSLAWGVMPRASPAAFGAFQLPQSNVSAILRHRGNRFLERAPTSQRHERTWRQNPDWRLIDDCLRQVYSSVKYKEGFRSLSGGPGGSEEGS